MAACGPKKLVEAVGYSTVTSRWEQSDARVLLGHHRRVLSDPGLAEAVLGSLAASGTIVREGALVRLPELRATTTGPGLPAQFAISVGNRGTQPITYTLAARDLPN